MTRSALFCILAAVLMCCAYGSEYKFTGRRSMPAHDIDCGQKDYNGKPQSFCKLCGGLGALSDACDANDKCKGFDMEGSYCGYLKAAAGKSVMVYTEGFSSYCKVGAVSDCTGDYSIKSRTDIPGKDVDCNAKNYKGEKLSYCQVSGNPTEAAAACNSNPACKAFTIVNGNGYLKTATGPTSYTEGATTYLK